jgi:hypothetical protein
MHSTGKPAELDTTLLGTGSDPYCGTPLGVEAAWCPNGIDVLRVAAAAEATMRPMER